MFCSNRQRGVEGDLSQGQSKSARAVVGISCRKPTLFFFLWSSSEPCSSASSPCRLQSCCSFSDNLTSDRHLLEKASFRAESNREKEKLLTQRGAPGSALLRGTAGWAEEEAKAWVRAADAHSKESQNKRYWHSKSLCNPLTCSTCSAFLHNSFVFASNSACSWWVSCSFTTSLENSQLLMSFLE